MWLTRRICYLDLGSMFGAEPAFLLYDEVREPQPHLAILKAITLRVGA
jgi:hypothetical protein